MHGSLRRRFALAHVLIPLAAAALVAGLLLLPAPQFTKAESFTVPEQDWGHVRAFDGRLDFILAPNVDQRRRYELGFGRVMFTSAAIFVADDTHGKNAVQLRGELQAGCLWHAQGAGVNVLVAIGKCVPGWAKVTGGTGHARMWIRVENLNPTPKVIQIQYA